MASYISAKPVKDTMADKQDKCGMVLCCIKELDGVSMGWLAGCWCSDDGYQYLSDLFEDSGVLDDDWHDKVYVDGQDDECVLPGATERVHLLSRAETVSCVWSLAHTVCALRAARSEFRSGP